jgi:AcrR family transcriptional regulator
MPKGFTGREKELIGARLREAGYKLFSAYGLQKTSVEELAEAAGISKGAFYIFYESKEALFMDVIEEVEVRFRRDILAAIEQPGLSPRARLFDILKQALASVESIPILQFITGRDFDVLFRRIPMEKFQEHLASDRQFFIELVERCRAVGIPIQVPPEQIVGLLYPLVLTILYKDNSIGRSFNTGADLYLELVAAYCLGEVESQLQTPGGLEIESQKGKQK